MNRFKAAEHVMAKQGTVCYLRIVVSKFLNILQMEPICVERTGTHAVLSVQWLVRSPGEDLPQVCNSAEHEKDLQTLPSMNTNE